MTSCLITRMRRTLDTRLIPPLPKLTSHVPQPDQCLEVFSREPIDVSGLLFEDLACKALECCVQSFWHTDSQKKGSFRSEIHDRWLQKIRTSISSLSSDKVSAKIWDHINV